MQLAAPGPMLPRVNTPPPPVKPDLRCYGREARSSYTTGMDRKGFHLLHKKKKLTRENQLKYIHAASGTSSLRCEKDYNLLRASRRELWSAWCAETKPVHISVAQPPDKRSRGINDEDEFYIDNSVSPVATATVLNPTIYGRICAA